MTHIQLIMKLYLTLLSLIVHDCLKMTKVISHWVSHQLGHERVKLCCENFPKFQNGSCRLCDIITDVER